MHDTDRTLAELGGGGPVFEPESYDFGEIEGEGGTEGEIEGEFEYDQEFEATAEEFEFETDAGGNLGEVEEMELAAELLGVTNEMELDQFLGKLIRRAAKGVRKLARTPLGNQLGGLLKGAAKKLVPVAGQALGGLVGGPAGAAIGGRVAAAASQALGLELEALSPEDREFEIARGYVRFASDAVKEAVRIPPRTPAAVAARAAVTRAAHRHAPGLVRRRRRGPHGAHYGPPTNGHPPQRGHWVRVAPGKIVLYGL